MGDALRAYDGLFEDNKIHAAVLGPACICRICGNGLGFAKAHLVETVGIDALGLQVVEYCLSPSVAQCLIILWGPNRVGVALELDRQIRVILHDVHRTILSLSYGKHEFPGVTISRLNHSLRM